MNSYPLYTHVPIRWTATLLLALLTFTFSTIRAQEAWDVPEERKGRLSPFEFSDSIQQQGAIHYSVNCASCHGTPGQGNFEQLDPLPADPATAAFQENTDGEIFYKVSEGRGLMPSFKNVLSAQEIWEVIGYLRTFNPDYVQQVMPTAELSAYGGTVELLMAYLADEHKIQVRAQGTRNGETQPIEAAEVALRVKRYFGDMMLDETQFTNQQGIVEFDAPQDLPGDENGNLGLSAQLVNQEMFGISQVDTTLAVGKAFVPVSLTRERAMWNVVQKAPIWLLLAYSLSVIIAWGIIFYILFQLKKIFDIGAELESK
jgi:mono/diheme cytochrome c family protein